MLYSASFSIILTRSVSEEMGYVDHLACRAVDLIRWDKVSNLLFTQRLNYPSLFNYGIGRFKTCPTIKSTARDDSTRTDCIHQTDKAVKLYGLA